MNSKIILFICFIFILTNASSAIISMSPPITKFNSLEDRMTCNEITLKTDYPIEVIGKDLWVSDKKDRGNIKKYNLTAKELDIEVDYTKNISINESKKITFCLRAKKPGNYSGTLLYRVKDRPIQIGIWIEAEIKNNGIIKITGNAVKNIEGVKARSLLLILPALLLGLLLILLLRLKKKR